MPSGRSDIERASGRNVVTAASAEAVDAGLLMFGAGGNAADAAVAALLTSCVTDIGAVCLGGEAAAIVFDASTGTPTVLAAQGGAPTDPRAIETVLSSHGSLAGIQGATTPAILDFCLSLLRDFGSLSFEDAAAPALSLLERGRPAVYFDTSLRKQLDACSGASAFLAATPPRDWAADAAQTLRTLIRAERGASGSRTGGLDSAADACRAGEVADQLATWYADRSGLLRKDDLLSHRTFRENGQTADYHGVQVIKPDTWTQGPWLLQALRLIEGLSGSDEYADAGARSHLVAEAIKLAMSDRDHHFGDPRFVEVPITALLSEEYVALRRGLIDSRVAGVAGPGDPIAMRARVGGRSPALSHDRSTIACITADRFGNVVVMTPSGVGSTAGSGGTTGITHGTRLNAANRTNGHPNCVAPGKRPCVTLSPTLLCRSGKPFLAMSLPGGQLQDQVALQMILEIVDRGARLDEIVERHAELTPVLMYSGLWGRTVRVPKPLLPSLGKDLKRRGHRVAGTSLSFFGLGGALVLFDGERGEFDACGLRARAL